MAIRIQEHKKEVEACISRGVRAIAASLSSTVHKSALTDQKVDYDHITNWSYVKILASYSQVTERQITESLEI